MDKLVLSRNRFLAILLFWLVMMMGFFIFKYVTYATGNEVLLKSAPVDPRDIFRGDYVILRYEVSSINLDSIQSYSDKYNFGDKVFVALDIEEGYGKAVGISHDPIDNYQNIRGEVKHISKNILDVKYGIESYFVQEGTGREIENSREDMYVKVVLDKKGRGIVKEIVME